MKTFSSFAALAAELVTVELGMYETLHHGLERVAAKIEKTAVDEIGHYQDAVGSFPAWPLLADGTEDAKAKAGYPADAPLLAAGDLKASYEHRTEGLEAVIGSDNPTAEYHEFGTSKMPARPVLGPAAFENKEAIHQLVGEAAVSGFFAGAGIHRALGYDFKTED